MDQGLGGGLSGVFSLKRPVASMYAATSCLMVFRQSGSCSLSPSTVCMSRFKLIVSAA